MLYITCSVIVNSGLLLVIEDVENRHMFVFSLVAYSVRGLCVGELSIIRPLVIFFLSIFGHGTVPLYASFDTAWWEDKHVFFLG